MKKTVFRIKALIFVILFIMPCVSISAERFVPAGIKQGPEIFAQLRHSSSVTSVAFSTDGRTLASGSKDGTTRILDTSTGKEIAREIPDN